MATRGKGEGGIFQRDNGLWVGRIELPPDRDGKRRRKEFTSKSKATVIRKMQALRKQLEQSGDIPSDNLTVEGWLTYWVREVAVKTRRPKTVEAYRSIITRQINPIIGHLRLSKVTGQNVRAVFIGMGDRSSTYKRNAHSVMSAAFRDAEREGRIVRNPVDLVDAPRKARTELEPLTADEAVKVILRHKDDPTAYLWAAFLLTGARRGEILGLEWDRVGEQLDLSWQLQRIKKGAEVPSDFESRHVRGELYWTRPKSRAGWRVIPLVDPLRSILEQWRTIAPPNPHGLVFTRQDSRGNTLPIDPDWTTRAWRSAMEDMGWGDKSTRIHDLRHTTVDLLYAANVPEDVISRIVGHSTMMMTRSYQSRDLGRLEAGMRALSKSLGL